MKDSLALKAAAELNRFLPADQNSARFPPLCRSYLRSIPGNRACVDCAAPNPEWASVTHGCLLCLQCSGRHRSYGVQTSFVRSVDMDDWAPSQILAMLEGGNGQLNGFFERHNLGHSSPLATKRYHTKAALFYRTHLSKHVAKVVQLGNYQGREASRKHYSSTSKNSRSQTTIKTTLSVTTTTDIDKQPTHLSDEQRRQPLTIRAQ